MTSTTESSRDIRARAACLQRLATALSGYHDLDVTVRAEGSVPCLAVHNTAATTLSETVTISATGDSLAYMWSWGERISDASDPDSAAQAIAYVLAAHGARPGRAS